MSLEGVGVLTMSRSPQLVDCRLYIQVLCGYLAATKRMPREVPRAERLSERRALLRRQALELGLDLHFEVSNDG